MTWCGVLIQEDNYYENDFNEVVRDIAGGLVEQMESIDNFSHPKTVISQSLYRITYRSMDSSLTN